MPAKVTLKMIAGGTVGEEFTFAERTRCLAGRHDSCGIRIIQKDDPQRISRYHCLLDINPPDVRIRDLGSRNGTYVNGKLIGMRKSVQPVQGAENFWPDTHLKDGDEVRLHNTVLQVSIHIPILCNNCSAEIPEKDLDTAQVDADVYQCRECRQRALTEQLPSIMSVCAKLCPRCGRDVSAETAEHRSGKYICRVCREDPFEILKGLLDAAKTGQKELAAIEGYSIIKELGRGGRGVVCLARHEVTNEQVALKLMLPEVAADQRAIDDFQREMRNAQVLDHRNVVRLRDAGTSDGTFFMTLDFCNSGSVDRLMQSRAGKVSIDEAMPIVLEALEGLHYAHHVAVPVLTKSGTIAQKMGLVHRDIKPHNIFLHTTGNQRIAKIGDYGFSKAFDAAGLTDHTCAGFTAGTPAFICRQQVINFRESKPEVDVWAMAATLYTMLTGQIVRDFSKAQESGTGRMDVWQIVLQSPVIPIRKREPGVPAKLADLIDTALDDRKDLYFKTARAFQQALLGAL